MEQIVNVVHYIDLFCAYLSQHVSVAKTQIYFSKSVLKGSKGT